MPLGVVAVVYEARPNVTIDAAALCLKSGNAIVLRGSSSAAHSNAVLAAIAAEAARPASPRARSRSSPAAAARSWPSWPRQDGRRRPDHPARRRGAEEGAEGGRDRAGDLRGVGQLPRLRRRRAPTSTPPSDRRSTPRPSARASATRPRRCSCTPTSPPTFLPRALRRAARGRRRAARRRARRARSPASGSRRRATEEDWDDGVPRARARGQGRRLASRRRSSTSTRTAPGHSEAIVTGDAAAARAFQLRRRRRLRLRQRLDALHRRRRVRHGRRDRQLDPEAPRARADRAARAVHVQVPGRGRRPGAGPELARIGILGGTFNPPHVGHLVCAQEALTQLGLDRVRADAGRTRRRTRRSRDDPGARRRLELCRLAVAATSGLEVSRSRSTRGPSFTVDTLRALHERDPGDELTFIVGGDMAQSLPAGASRGHARARRAGASPSARASAQADRPRRARGAAGRRGARALLRHAAHRHLVLA